MTLKRSALALGAAALMTVSLSACGGSKPSGPPTNASKADFCKAYHSSDGFGSVGSGNYDAAATALVTMAGTLKATGTPSDTPADARAGFETTVDVLGSVTGDKLKQAAAAMKSITSGHATGSEGDQLGTLFGISKADGAKIETFINWADQTC